MAAGATMREPGSIKRGPRVDTNIDATVVGSDGLETPVVVTNVSRGGFRLKTKSPLRIGERVTLQIEGNGYFRAQIRWALGPDAGGVFIDPTNFDDFAS